MQSKPCLGLIFDLYSSLDAQQAVGSTEIIRSVGAGVWQRGAAMQETTLSHCSLGHVGNRSSHGMETETEASSAAQLCHKRPASAPFLCHTCSACDTTPSVQEALLVLVFDTMHWFAAAMEEVFKSGVD